jgi:hypothetical protein
MRKTLQSAGRSCPQGRFNILPSAMLRQLLCRNLQRNHFWRGTRHFQTPAPRNHQNQ